MPRTLSDTEVAAILAEPKETGRGQLTRLENIAKGTSKHHRGHTRVTSKSGRKLSLRVNVNARRPNGFSVILSYLSRGRNINLIRCNGHHGPHTNRLEKEIIPKGVFHIHRLTERYQVFGRGEHYAEPTDEYHSAASALEYLCNRFFVIDGTDKSDGYTKRYPLLE